MGDFVATVVYSDGTVVWQTFTGVMGGMSLSGAINAAYHYAMDAEKVKKETNPDDEVVSVTVMRLS